METTCEEREGGGEAWCVEWGGEVAVCTERDVAATAAAAAAAAAEEAMEMTERRDEPE